MSDSIIVKSYSYKPKKLMLLLGILLFGPAAWLFYHMAQTNDQGVIIKVSGIELLSLIPSEATVFYWSLCAAAVCLSIAGLFGLFKAFTSIATVDLSEEAITLPKGPHYINKPVTIPYVDIIRMDLQKIYHLRFLTIIHTNGKVDISDDMLQNKSQLDEIFEFVEKRCNSNAKN